jgi:signal transduction histidine kinase
MSKKTDSINFSGVDRVRITKIQALLALIAVAALAALGISTINESRSAGDRTHLLSNLETPAASIIFTQRETLVYSTRLALWSNGGTTRRDVQIARALLGQRLAVVDSSGKSMGQRANTAYWRALKKSDELVAAAPPGILPESMHRALNVELIPIIDDIVEQARTLVVSYQREVDLEMKLHAEDMVRTDARNLSLLYIFIAAGALFLFLNARTNFRNYRAIKQHVEKEQSELESVRHQVAQLQDLDEAKNALISNVNHELRTPLTSIMGYIELLQREKPEQQSPEHRLYLEVLQRNSLILLTLVESLLSLSKFDSGAGKLPDQPVSISEVIDSALFALKPALEKSEITSKVSVSENLYVRGDQSQLSQVFINLIANSIKFSPSGSEVAIEVARNQMDTKMALISITDHGIGIAPENIPYIFDRFYRVEQQENGEYDGTGLGLAIVDQVIKHHQGLIEVSSTLGKGSIFTVSLPLFSEVEVDE